MKEIYLIQFNLIQLGYKMVNKRTRADKSNVPAPFLNKRVLQPLLGLKHCNFVPFTIHDRISVWEKKGEDVIIIVTIEFVEINENNWNITISEY